MTEEQDRRDAERHHDELNKYIALNREAAIRSGEAAVRWVLLANGGAIIAVLSFLGSMSAHTNHPIDQVAKVANSLIWFAFGVAAALFALMFSYFTNLYYASHGNLLTRIWRYPYSEPGPKTAKWDSKVRRLHVGAIIASVVSLALFLWVFG